MRDDPRLGQVVLANYGREQVTGQIACPLTSTLYLLVTPQGTIRTVYYTEIFLPGERDVFGRVPWDPQRAEVEEIREATSRLLKAKGMQTALSAIVRSVERDQARLKNPPSYDLPLAMVINKGGFFELSPRLIRYLQRPQEERDREQAALALLKSGKAGSGSERQYQVLMACYYGTTPQSWVAKAWGIRPSAVHKLLQKAKNFMAAAMGADEIEPVNERD